MKEFQYGLMDIPALMSDPMVTTGMASFLDSLDQTPELVKYKPYFEKIKDNYMQKTSDMLTEYRTNFQADGYYVLCHGDFHLKNMMFRHNKDTAAFEDVMLVDFQICNLCPATVDVIYSIYMLMEQEQRWDQAEDLINYYYSVLEETLKKVDYKGKMPTRDGLWKQIRRHKIYGKLINNFKRSI